MVKILFVCHGNICRSPMAEFVLKDIVKKAGRADEFYIASAATSTEEIGNDIHLGTRAVLRSHGIPFERRAARQITKADYENFDYIIGMDEYNMRNLKRMLGDDKCKKLYKLLEFAGSSRDVADPWYTGDFNTTYEDVLLGCNALINRIFT